MSRRSRAREVALQALHQLEFNPEAAAGGGLRRFFQGRLRSTPLVAFAEELVAGVVRHRADLDALLEARSPRWRVARMSATDRTVLRIAAYEIVHTATPGPVVADEAIDLARRYGNEASPRFVAGVLGAVLEDRRSAAGSDG